MLSKSVIRVLLVSIVEKNTQSSIRIAEEIMPERADRVGFSLKLSSLLVCRDPSSACTLT